MEETRFNDFLEFAIGNEIEAALLYEKYAGMAAFPAQKRLLEKMAVMERGHEAALKKVVAGNQSSLPSQPVPEDLHLADFLVDGPLSPDSSIEEVLIFSIKAEQKAFDLYSRLADLEEEPATKALLMKLAGEEKRHKFDLESQFEKGFMKEN
jgi:rubrerythrin